VEVLQGEAVQVEPMKPVLKPSETNRLKLGSNEQLSTFAFKFNLRRYIKTFRRKVGLSGKKKDKVGRCRLTR